MLTQFFLEVHGQSVQHLPNRWLLVPLRLVHITPLKSKVFLGENGVIPLPVELVAAESFWALWPPLFLPTDLHKFTLEVPFVILMVIQKLNIHRVKVDTHIRQFHSCLVERIVTHSHLVLDHFQWDENRVEIIKLLVKLAMVLTLIGIDDKSIRIKNGCVDTEFAHVFWREQWTIIMGLARLLCCYV